MALIAGLVMATVGVPAWAAVSVTAGGPFAYTEQAAPVTIGSGLSLDGGTFYDDEYLEFEIESATTVEHLSLATDDTASSADGVVSLVGDSVYLGDGANAELIGTIDGTLDGRNGRSLRVNFTAPTSGTQRATDVGNAGFESGALAPWTPIASRIDLGSTSIAGYVAQDQSSYPSNAPNEDNNAPSSAYEWTVEVSTDGQPPEGTHALRLFSRITTRQGCDVVHGPAVYSAEFPATAGDWITFDWRAYNGSDAFAVYGYLLNTGTGEQHELLDAYPTSYGNTDWAQKATFIPATGSYRFVFVSGTWDRTCGRAAGASLFIDDVRVFPSRVSDAVASAVAQRLQYANTSDDPATTRTVNVTAQSTSSGSGTGAITVNVTPVNDPPTAVAAASTSYDNHLGDEDFPTSTGTLTATDPDDATTDMVYGIDGGASGTYAVDGTTYDTSLAGTYGTLYVASAGGAWAVVPDDTAIDARLTPDSETFTITASDGEAAEVVSNTFTLSVAVPPSAPGAPTDVAATPGDEQATVTWTAPTWLGGAPVSDYVVQYSSDGGSTWATFGDGTSATTTATVTGLTAGLAHVFRIAALNANGQGPWSAPSAAVTPKTQQPTLTVSASDFTYGDTTTVSTAGGAGTGDVTVTVDSGPCTLAGTTLSATGPGTCTLGASKAGDTTYYDTTASSVDVVVAPKPLTVTGASVPDHVYDATTDASVAGATLTGVETGDDVTLIDDTAGTFATRNVGTDIAVTPEMGLTGPDADKYTLVQPALRGDIVPRTVHVEGASVTARVYDGTTDATIAGATLVGAVTGDDVTLTDHTTGTFDRAAIGTGIPVTTSMGLAGADAGNYVLVQPTLAGAIAALEVTVEGATVTPRVYDGTTDADITGATLVGALDGDDVVLADHTTGTFGSRNVGTGIPVATSMTLTGQDADNYALVQPTLAGTITPKAMTVEDAVVRPHIYDGTTRATIADAALVGAVAGDDVALANHRSGTFAQDAAGSSIPVDVAMTLVGDDAGNYALEQPTLSGTILRRVVQVEGASVPTRVYDGTPDAEIVGATAVGFVPGDDVSLVDHTAGTFAQSDAKAGIAVVTAMTLAGTDAANYALVQPVLDGTIVRRPITVSGAHVEDRAYDGTDRALVSGATLAGVLAGDDVALVGHTTGRFAQMAPGGDVRVRVAMELVGADATNYLLTPPALAATIAPRELHVIDAAVTPRQADGTTAATITGATLDGVLDGDDVRLVGADSGVFASAAPGTDIPVTTAMRLVGADAGRYRLVQPDLSGRLVPVPTIDEGSRVGRDAPTAGDGTVGAAPGGAAYEPGASVVSQLCGLQPGSRVEVVLVEGNRPMGAWSVDGDGCAMVDAKLPATMVAGAYELRYDAVDQAGEPVSLHRSVEVDGDDLAATGATPTVLALLALIALALGGGAHLVVAPVRRHPRRD